MAASAEDGWDDSAAAWIAEQGDEGDFGRRFVLDAPMLERIHDRGFRHALDVGGGEGRFCRIMQAEGIRTVGIDPTAALLARARELDPMGDYRLGTAETLDIERGSFDLVVSYLTLIDMPDLETAVARIVEALRPAGTLLIANLNPFNTAGMPDGWTKDSSGVARFSIDHYLDERAVWVEWRGIRIRNWHRPLSTYISLFLWHGLELRHFSEPAPTGGDPKKADRYRRVPYFHIMEWRKSAA
jgi:SAM-dependent methyltransferase